MIKNTQLSSNWSKTQSNLPLNVSSSIKQHLAIDPQSQEAYLFPNKKSLENFLNFSSQVDQQDDDIQDLFQRKSLEMIHKKSLKLHQFQNLNQTGMKEEQSKAKELKIGEVYGGHKSIICKKKGSGCKQIMVNKKIIHQGSHKSRQVEVLRRVSGHPFIVSLFDVSKVAQPNGYYIEISLEFYDSGNLLQRIYTEGALDFLTVKIFAYQLFRGLNFIHSMNICHRNIKTSNLFLRGNHLSIGGFSRAKFVKEDQNNCLNVCNGLNRAPQILMGNRNYNEKIDIWSAGCVVVEMILGRKLFRGETQQQNLLIQIFKMRGSPTLQELSVLNPNFYNILEHWKLPTNLSPKSWASILEQQDLGPDLSSFLDNLFKFNFNQRISALQALAHPYFDDIRQYQKYHKMSLDFNLEQDFFTFAFEELPETHRFLVPQWVRPQSI